MSISVAHADYKFLPMEGLAGVGSCSGTSHFPAAALLAVAAGLTEQERYRPCASPAVCVFGLAAAAAINSSAERACKCACPRVDM